MGFVCFVLADSVCCFAGSQVLRSFRVSDVECRFVFVAGFHCERVRKNSCGLLRRTERSDS